MTTAISRFTRPNALPELDSTEAIGWAVAQLALARGSSIDTPTVLVYQDALGDLDPVMVERACFDLARVTRKDYESALPSAPAIRERVGQIAKADEAVAKAARMLPEPKSDDDGPRFFCVACHDEPSGWQTVRCGGSGPHAGRALPPHEQQLDAQHCGRRDNHPSHTFVVRCTCWQRNPVVARRKAAQQARKAS